MLTKEHRLLAVSFFLPLIGLFLSGTLPAWAETPTAPPETIILISLDTTRADHLSCYGYEHETTPNIDALANQSLFFEHPFAPAPMTQPAHASMFTGTLPPTHGIHENLVSNLSPSVLTLAEILKQHDFTTYGIVSSKVLAGNRGFSQGFDYYDDSIVRGEGDPEGLTMLFERNAKQTTERALQWLSDNAQKKKFMFIHYFDAHDAYEPPAPFDTQFENPYDGEIAFMDHAVGQVLDRLKALDLYDNALIALVGDHGEMLGEHGEPIHGYYIYQNVLRVPLMFKLPGAIQSKKIADPCSLIDVAPTLLSMAGLAVPEAMQGVNLAGYLDPEFALPNRAIYCESMTPTSYNCSSLLGLVMGKWHYIQTNRPELYDRLEDPTEMNNLVAQYPAQASKMKDRLQRLLHVVERSKVDNAAVLDAETVQELAALGYLDSDVKIDYSFKEGVEDAKDMLLVRNRLVEAVDMGRAGREAEAIPICTEIIKQYPNVRHTYHILSTMHSMLGEHDKAIPVIEQQLTVLPEYTHGFRQLFAIYHGTKQYSKAIEALKKIIALEPDDAMAYNKLMSIYMEQGGNAKAIDTMQRRRAVVPDDLESLMMLGQAYQRLNDAPNALTCFLDALKLAPNSVDAHVGAGGTYYTMRNLTQALSHYEQALALDSNQPAVQRAVAGLRRAIREYPPQ